MVTEPQDKVKVTGEVAPPPPDDDPGEGQEE